MLDTAPLRFSSLDDEPVDPSQDPESLSPFDSGSSSSSSDISGVAASGLITLRDPPEDVAWEIRRARAAEVELGRSPGGRRGYEYVEEEEQDGCVEGRFRDLRSITPIPVARPVETITASSSAHSHSPSPRSSGRKKRARLADVDVDVTLRHAQNKQPRSHRLHSADTSSTAYVNPVMKPITSMEVRKEERYSEERYSDEESRSDKELWNALHTRWRRKKHELRKRSEAQVRDLQAQLTAERERSAQMATTIDKLRATLGAQLKAERKRNSEMATRINTLTAERYRSADQTATIEKLRAALKGKQALNDELRSQNTVLEKRASMYQEKCEKAKRMFEELSS